MQLQGYQSMKRGYTLIEILVGMTIIGILFSAGYVSFRDFSRRQALSGIVKGLQGDIRLVQEQAASGKKPDNPKCNGVNLLDGYNFSVNAASGSYSVAAKCTGGLVEIKNVVLPSDVGITAPLPNPVFFKSLSQGTNIPSGESVTITLTQTATGDSATLTISASGEIK